MKAAIVLGLAAAATAQVDNEFVGYNPSGANLVRDAGWSQTHPSGVRTPIDYNTRYLNNYGLKHDDAADDEMMIYVDRSGQRHIFPSNYENKPITSAKDDAADDEMMVYYTKDSRGVNHYQGGVRRDDAADDEMIVYYTKDSKGVNHYQGVFPRNSNGVKHYQGGYTRRDDEADNELAELVKYLIEYKVHERKPLLNRRRDDDITDDELAELQKLLIEYKVHPRKPLLNRRDDDITDDELAELQKLIVEYRVHERKPLINRRKDDATDDDELAELQKLLVEYRVHERKPLINRRKDDATDDELVQTFYSPSGADLVKYAKESQQTVYRPTAYPVRRDDEAAENELAELQKLLVEYRVHERKPLINRRHLRYVQLE